MTNFWDFSSWGFFNLVAVLLASLLAANMLKRSIPLLEKSLIPTSVLGGGILLVISATYNAISGEEMFDTAFFGGNGSAWLELITYHMLALGFTASALKSSNSKMTKERSTEIFNTGLTTVATYLLQAFVGMIICIIGAIFLKDLLEASGLLLALGYGQGPGQAMNYGGIYEIDYGFTGGKSFGLTVASMGFLSASIGGVIYLNILKRRGKINLDKGSGLSNEQVEGHNEIPMQQSIDKFTIPGGDRRLSMCHVCRTICRRAERAALRADQEHGVAESAKVYLNRLSDLYYTLGRTITLRAQVEEILWRP